MHDLWVVRFIFKILTKANDEIVDGNRGAGVDRDGGDSLVVDVLVLQPRRQRETPDELRPADVDQVQIVITADQRIRA